MEQKTFAEFEFEGSKNKGTILCTSMTFLDYLLHLEWDITVSSYFQPQMKIVVDFEGSEYLAGVKLWVDYRNGKTCLVDFIDSKTEKLYSDHPELYAEIKSSCKSMNLHYRAINVADTKVLPLSWNLKFQHL
ncbi:MAG: hypothetical protein WKF92_15775 [Pyrinomonadaceae bacterium]